MSAGLHLGKIPAAFGRFIDFAQIESEVRP